MEILFVQNLIKIFLEMSNSNRLSENEKIFNPAVLSKISIFPGF
ncbi:hypothetical protein M595_0954 [Lyngbya aestuarii BL J]|uniref:Uncharacterized protein n=1 Tax=Lyngbya aestuarii BL J TaxID=1348334 RepID=U7QNY0_9CYAN|nr:hypothetical protein M595_0954 [Lyngbya aestuarii BL J]